MGPTVYIPSIRLRIPLCIVGVFYDLGPAYTV